MQRPRPSRAQLRLCALLTLAFVIVGVSSGIAILKLSLDRYQRDYTTELTNLASLTSLVVDPNAHEKLVTPNQMNSELYRNELAKLAEAKRKLSGIRYIYTLRKVQDDYVFVLDPTPPGDHDADGTDDKSYLGDPYPEVSSSAKAAYNNGVVTVDSEPTFDRWGAFISGFAPIKDSSGKVVGILGIDRLADDIVDHKRDLLFAVSGGLTLVLILGTFFGWAFARRIAIGERLGWMRYLTGSNRIFRATILEVVLGGLSVIVFIGAIQSVSSQQHSFGEFRKSLDRSATLVSFQKSVNATPLTPTSSQIEYLTEKARHADLAWLYQHFRDLSNDPKAADGLRNIRDELITEIDREQQRQRTLQAKMDTERSNLISLFFVSAFMAVGTIAIVRTASIQHQDLIAAKTDCERHEIAYRQVVENLPIGLFVYSNGKITFSNATWDRQCGRGEKDDRLAKFEEGLSPADRDDLLNRLEHAQRTASGFKAQYKLTKKHGYPHTFEAQVSALLNTDLEPECLLGFTVDLTQRISAQDQLAHKNREVHQKNRLLRRGVKNLQENIEAMVQTLVKAIEAKCIYTAGHSERVMRYCVAIGERWGLTASELKTLRMGALLHDVGKIGVPDEILTKPDKLTAQEFEIIKAHAENGARLIEDMPIFRECVPIVRWHHERLNGSGYPDQLQGDDIPLLVQMVAVADVFDAMTSNRSYRMAHTRSDAIAELRNMAAEGQLNPEFVEILADIVDSDRESWSTDSEWAA